MKTEQNQAPGFDLDSEDNTGLEALKASASTLPALPPDAMILIPLRYLVLFPGMIAPISLSRFSSIAAAQEVVRRDYPVGLILQRDPEVESPTPEHLYRIGTVATVLRYLTAQDGGNYLVCQGERRFRIIEFLDSYPFQAARVQHLPDTEENAADIQARLIQLKERVAEIIQLLPSTPAEAFSASDLRDALSASILARLASKTFLFASLARRAFLFGSR